MSHNELFEELAFVMFFAFIVPILYEVDLFF